MVGVLFLRFQNRINMKILQFGNTDLVGKRFNGHSLHKYFLKLRIDSSQLVWKKDSDDRETFEFINIFGKRIINSILIRLERYLSLQSLISPFPLAILFNKRFRDADVVHYHLIHTGFFNLLALPILTRIKPSVWTLHDPWAMTGHCIHPLNGCMRWKTGCGKCPDLKIPLKISFDNTGFIWRVKKFVYSKSRFHLIVASKWMLDMVRESPLMVNFSVSQIPLGVDLSIFRRTDPILAKNKLGIDSQALVLSFRAVESEFKGLNHIKESLRSLRTDKKICLLTFNEVGLMDEFKDKFQVIDLGWVDDEQLLAEAYNAADIFLMPSIAEAFGMMAVEAMACGKPIIVFDKTALSEVTFSPKGAIAVPQGDSQSLRVALERLINDPIERERLGECAETIAIQNYSFDVHANRVLQLYKKILNKNLPT